MFPANVTETLSTGLASFLASFDASQAIKTGATFPSFTLLDRNGDEVTRDELLSHGPILLTFFRGNWCPYCNVALRELQNALPQIRDADANVQVVTVSPQLPAFIQSVKGDDKSTTATSTQQQQLNIFADKNNALAQSLGLSWHLPIGFDQCFKQLGMNIHAENEQQEGQLRVPVPASFYIDQRGIVKRAFVDPDFTKRLEPSEAVKWVSEEASG